MNKGGVIVAMLSVAAMSSGITAGCGDINVGERGDPIRIGVIVSLSGGLESVGPHLEDSATLAVREINAAGGLLGGRRVEVIVKDDRTDPARAAVVAQELVDEGAVAVVGSLASSASLEVQSILATAQIPQVSCCSTSEELTNIQPETDRYFFRTVPSDLLQAVVLSQYAEEDLACERLAILHLNDSYGNPFGDGIESRFGAGSGTVVAKVAFAEGQASYTEEVSMIAGAMPDCIALVAFATDGGSILRDWNALPSPPAVTWIGTDGIKTDGFPEAAGDNTIVDGVQGTAPITEPPASAAFNAFASAFEATFSEPPGIFGGNQYDATASLLLAIEAANTTEGSAVRDALYLVTNPQPEAPVEDVITPGSLATGLQTLRSNSAVNYEGATGPVDIDTFGNVVSDYEIWGYRADSDTFESLRTIRASEIEQ